MYEKVIEILSNLIAESNKTLSFCPNTLKNIFIAVSKLTMGNS